MALVCIGDFRDHVYCMMIAQSIPKRSTLSNRNLALFRAEDPIFLVVSFSLSFNVSLPFNVSFWLQVMVYRLANLYVPYIIDIGLDTWL